MERILDNIDTYNKNVQILFPIINYSDNTGTLSIDKDKFDLLLKKCLEKYGKYDKSSIIYYKYFDMTYQIVNCRNISIYKTDYFNIINNERTIISVFNEIKIDENEFPIIDEYHNICKKNIMVFKSENINILLITESNSDYKTIYYPEISFINNDINNESVRDIINFINDLLL